ncbi:hypothetical protein [Shewanella algae]|uniref:hypothetical protein n=1 Tax=Shewanella algae TaxID=38313 RepID=UPI001F44664F|nr:hypothetical protein [Shewanella algae]MCE9785936.1 hypothetical protein [Shewanella algae]
MRYVSFFFVAFLSFGIYSKDFSLQLSTNINISELYRDAIEKVYFEPSELVLESTEDKKRFKDILTSFNITSKIPREAASVGYIITLDNNKAFCQNISGGAPVLQPDFVSIYFEEKLIAVGDSLAFSDFNLDDGIYKTSQHPVMLSFKPFDEIITEDRASICNGEINISVGVDI